MKDISKILRIFLEEWRTRPVISVLIFFIGLTIIAYIIDTMITYTFPAYTLIAVVILITNIAIKIYEKLLIKDNLNKFNQDKFKK